MCVYLCVCALVRVHACVTCARLFGFLWSFVYWCVDACEYVCKVLHGYVAAHTAQNTANKQFHWIFYFLSILQSSWFVSVVTKCLPCRVGMDGWRKHVPGVKSDPGEYVCVCVCVCVCVQCAVSIIQRSYVLLSPPSTLFPVGTHKKRC